MKRCSRSSPDLQINKPHPGPGNGTSTPSLLYASMGDPGSTNPEEILLHRPPQCHPQGPPQCHLQETPLSCHQGLPLLAHPEAHPCHHCNQYINLEELLQLGTHLDPSHNLKLNLSLNHNCSLNHSLSHNPLQHWTSMMSELSKLLCQTPPQVTTWCQTMGSSLSIDTLQA